MPIETALRELLEETGVAPGNVVESIGTLYISLPQLNYAFHMFHTHLSEMPEIEIAEKEVTDFQWLTIKEAYALPLIAAGREALEFLESWQLPDA